MLGECGERNERGGISEEGMDVVGRGEVGGIDSLEKGALEGDEYT